MADPQQPWDNPMFCALRETYAKARYEVKKLTEELDDLANQMRRAQARRDSAVKVRDGAEQLAAHQFGWKVRMNYEEGR